MKEKTQNLSIRLLRQESCPESSLRAGVTLKDWPIFPDGKIATGSLGGGPPRWADFLRLSADATLDQRFAYALVYLRADERWFAITFGLGHSKVNPLAIEQDFGLRVVVNAVDHKKLRSADLRTPDVNTLSRRSQTSRASERSAFEIDPERDIVRGLLGEPKDKTFASHVSGSDALNIRRKLRLEDLPALCSRALTLSKENTYKEEFGWIDQIRHVREPTTLETLDTKLAEALTAALAREPDEVDDLSLAYPTIYDPDKTDWIRFRGMNLRTAFPDLEIAHYLAGLRGDGTTKYDVEFLTKHLVQECDETGQTLGHSWPLRDCLVYETELTGHKFTLSAGRWYQISPELAEEVTDYFLSSKKVNLPAANAGDNEKRYNDRIAKAEKDLLCLDVRLVKPSGSSSPIEVCDFLGKDGRLIHIKDKTESSRLSHLFNQGLVSAITLKSDATFRDRVRQTILKEIDGGNFVHIIPDGTTGFTAANFTVVFGVLVNDSSKKQPMLPFFSLVSFRHAAKRIESELGYKVAFAWIKKPRAGTGRKIRRIQKATPSAPN